MLTIQDLMSDSKFKATPKGAVLRGISDGGAQIVWWPSLIAPKSHEEACSRALSIIRGKGDVPMAVQS